MAILYPELSYAIVGAAMEVHGQLGSGFLEQVYENALAHELTLQNIPFLRQVQVPVHYKGVLMGNYVADMHDCGEQNYPRVKSHCPNYHYPSKASS